MPGDRRGIADAICADIVALRIEQDPGAAAELRRRFPQYAKSRNRTSLASQGKRWDRALVAGVVFLRQMKEAARRDEGGAGNPEASVPLQIIAESIWIAREGGDEVNYDSRIHDTLRDEVRKYHPVAHLVAAYQYASRHADSWGLRMEFDYDNLDFHRVIVKIAATFARYIQDTPELARAAERLIEIEWRE